MSVELIDHSKVGESDEWSVITPEDKQEVPFFGTQDPTAEQLAETAEKERFEALTPEQQAEELKTKETAAAGETEEEKEAARFAALSPEDQEKETKAKEEAAAGTETPEAKAEREKAETLAAEKKKWLADMGFESEEDIKKLKTPAVAETPEEKTLRLEREEASFMKFAVDKGKMSLSEINAFKQFSEMPPRDLVYANFALEYKEANKDRKDTANVADPVTDDEIATEFNNAYHTESDNSVLKKSGERAIDARAKEILADGEKKYTEAKKEYDFLASRAAVIPHYKNFVQGTLKEEIPANRKFTVDGHDFIVEMDGTDFANIEATFKNNDVLLNEFATSSDKPGLKERVAASVRQQIAAKYEAKLVEIAFRSGHGQGLKEGKVGARAPFEEKKKPDVPASVAGLTPEERQQIRDGHSKP